MTDLNFNGQNTLYATHGLHAYAAKCPPQLARYAIEQYSRPGDTLIDPMVGSGTTLVEARLAGRNALGFDIDPLACLIAQAKCKDLPDDAIQAAYSAIIQKMEQVLQQGEDVYPELPEFTNRDYWFSSTVSTSLAALSSAIQSIDNSQDLRNFFWVAFSGIILSKVSVANARDIIHSRHHFFQHAAPPNVIMKFSERVRKMRNQMADFRILCQQTAPTLSIVQQADARHLPLADQSIDLVFTSPPYATALDYPRAHFLAVGWMQSRLGLTVDQYKGHGATYIGSERGSVAKTFEPDEKLSSFPVALQTLVKLSQQDSRQAILIQRYWLDMHAVFEQISRVLKPESHAVIVVCPSHIRKVEIPTHRLLTEIAQSYGLILKEERTRTIDAGRRVLPYMQAAFGDRMSTEYVLVYQKEKKA